MTTFYEAILKNHSPLSTKEIMKIEFTVTGKNKSSASTSNSLTRLVKLNRIKKVTHGLYAHINYECEYTPPEDLEIYVNVLKREQRHLTTNDFVYFTNNQNNKKAVYGATNRLVKMGKIKTIAKGLYALPHWEVLSNWQIQTDRGLYDMMYKTWS